MVTDAHTHHDPFDVPCSAESVTVYRSVPLPACILVAYDDPLMLELLEFKLTARGYSVIKASDGAEALASAIRHRPDLIVLDALMPVIDGFEVLRRLRRNKRTEMIPVIVLTGRKQEGGVLEGVALGAHDFFVKPFIPEELVARIGRVLAGSDRRIA
jgi:DNA-binding response OmpR family regulator